ILHMIYESCISRQRSHRHHLPSFPTRRSSDLDDRGQYAETSYRLSILSVRNCDNQRLTQMLTALSLQTLRYSYISLAPIERRQASAALWRKGLDALERGDTRTYIAVSRQRVEESGRAVVRRLSESSQEPARRRA